MILEISVALLAIVVMGFLIAYSRSEISKEKSKISIKESIDLVQIPVLTFQDGDTKLNFILDSGSSHSHISRSAEKIITGTPVNVDYSYTTSMGSDAVSEMVETTLKYKSEEFKVKLFINEGLNSSFEGIKKESGVQLHGILGADFLKEHKYVLDFAELVAYHK